MCGFSGSAQVGFKLTGRKVAVLVLSIYLLLSVAVLVHGASDSDASPTTSKGRGGSLVESPNEDPLSHKPTKAPAAPTFLPRRAYDLADHLIRVAGLLFLSATFAGLTMGIMGFDTLSLEIIAESGPKPDCQYAQEILPLRRHGHMTLCTLIVGNMLANVLIVQEMVAIQDDAYALIRRGAPKHASLGMDRDNGEALTSFILSTLVIMIFTEVLPMSLCKSKYALRVASIGVPLVRVAMVLTWPIVYPLGRLLDALIAHDAGQIYDRNELKKLMTMHLDMHAEKSGLQQSEVSLMVAALDFHSKRVKEVMTPVERVFSVDLDEEITPAFLERLWRSGRSRVPVATREGVFCDVLLVRDLITFSNGPSGVSLHGLPRTVRDLLAVKTRNVPTVDENTPLHKMLLFFERVNTHMAIVHRVKAATPTADVDMGVSPVVMIGASTAIDLHHSNAATPTTATVENRTFDHLLRGGAAASADSRIETVGIITLEDVVEELISQEIYDEYDESEDDGTPHAQQLGGECSSLSKSPSCQNMSVDPLGVIPASFTNTNSHAALHSGQPAGSVRVPRPPAKRPRVNFYSYYVHDNEDLDLSEGQKWALAYYLIDSCSLFTNWKVGYVRHLLDEVGDQQLRPGAFIALHGTQSHTVPDGEDGSASPKLAAMAASPSSCAQPLLLESQPVGSPTKPPIGRSRRNRQKKQQQQQLFHSRQSISGNFRQPHSQRCAPSVDSAAPTSAKPYAPHLDVEEQHKLFAESATSDDMLLYQMGVPSHEFTIVLSGSVDILLGRDGFVSQIRSFRWLGEEAIISDLYVPEFTAVVRVPTRLVRIPRDKYDALATVATLAAGRTPLSLVRAPSRQSLALLQGKTPTTTTTALNNSTIGITITPPMHGTHGDAVDRTAAVYAASQPNTSLLAASAPKRNNSAPYGTFNSTR